MTTLSDLAELVRAPAALSAPGDALAGTLAVAAVPITSARTARWGGRRLLATALAAGYAASYGWPQSPAVAEPTPANLQAAVAAGITGLPALHGALLARSGAPVTAAAVAAAAPLGRRLARRWSPT